MDERHPDDDRDALAALSDVPPPRKAYSYSQQLRVGSGHKHHRQVRKHSLDEDRIPKDLESYYDSSDDDFFPYASTSQRLDQSLAIGDLEGHRQPLPEFTASGSEAAPFKAPVRAPVHPNRPPCLELRPHPLRETQVGKFLRTITCTDTQLWAGLESGVRVWSFANAYEPGCGVSSKVRRGDEDAAPFHESTNTSAVMCLIVDLGCKLVWGGHKDGKIRSWKTEQAMDGNPFKEGLSWQAHKGPVVSLVMTSYGDIWSGSEGGVIKIWPWEAVEKSLMLSPEERHMAALLVERSYIDLRSQVTVNGVCNISSADVKFLLSDNIKAKVWCAASLSFSLWDARTRELLKVFNVDGQIENRVDMPSASDQAVEDEMKVKFVASTSKKEKSQGSSFLQRSRNAIMGAADAVRRVATKGANAFSEDGKRTEALLQTADGMIWSGCANGTIVQWDGSGNRVQDFNYHTSCVQCFCTFGTRIYVGYSSGMVQLVDLEGKLITGWIAHNNPVLKLAVGSKYVFSLAAHGGVRGWNIISPGPIDTIIRSELAAKEAAYTRRENLRILVGTWNVGQGRTSHDCLISWLGSVSSDVGIVVVGLQEVEMGAGFLAMSAAKETVGLEGSTIGQSWQDTIGKALDEGSTFERMGSRQLAGLLITLWVRKNIRTHVGDIDAAAVPCGFGRAIGNKGAVGLRIRVYDRIICFVNCHFAAHLDAVSRRNADFDHVYRTMTFNRCSNIHNVAAVSVSSSAQIPSSKASSNSADEGRPELSEADMVVFLGDFNYRLHGISYDEARDFVSQRCFDWLREKDQLRAEMKAGKVFQGMREAVIRFPPTYKFERHQAGLGGYDSGEKKRIPAWCDRVLFRDTCSNSVSECSLECPVVSSVLQYEACMDITDSDHKPVRCKFDVEISHAERSIRRKEFGLIVNSNEKLRSLFDDLCYVPDIMLSTNSIVLQNQDISTVRIANKSTSEKAIFRITCEGLSALQEDGKSFDLHPARSAGLPTWLEVTPGGGILKAEQTMEICVRHAELHTPEESGDGIPQNWWSTDTRDKLVILAVNVQSSRSTEIRSHRISVRCCFSTKTIRVNSKSKTTLRRYSGNSSHHSSAQGISEA